MRTLQTIPLLRIFDRTERMLADTPNAQTRGAKEQEEHTQCERELMARDYPYARPGVEIAA